MKLYMITNNLTFIKQPFCEYKLHIYDIMPIFQKTILQNIFL